MVHTTRRFTAPNEANARKTFLVVSAFVNELEQKSVLDIFKEKGLSTHIKNKSSIEEIDEIARDSRVSDGHLELYSLYHEELRKNSQALYKNMNKYEPIFLPVFSTVLEEPKKWIKERIRVELRTSAGPKKGFDSFSGLHKISSIIEKAERNNSLENFLDGVGSKFVYLPASPILTFGVYDNKLDITRNYCDDFCETSIISNVNQVLSIKGKKEFSEELFEKFKSGLYQVNPAFYDASLFKREIKNEKEYEYAKNVASYNELMTAILWGEVISNINNIRFYYFGEKSNPSYSILKKACALSGKKMLPVKIMENTKVPVAGACAPEALNKFLGYFKYKMISDEAEINKPSMYKIDVFFDKKHYERFFK